MTPTEAAASLNGSQYRDEGTRDFFNQMKADGLVAVFGASDDLTEFRGAIDDECGLEAFVTPDGLLENECENDNCPHFAKLKKRAAKIQALFSTEGFTFVYRTEIPHKTFIVYEDEDTYCRGIVFALADVDPE